jgi:hypothetical protein
VVRFALVIRRRNSTLCYADLRAIPSVPLRQAFSSQRKEHRTICQRVNELVGPFASTEVVYAMESVLTSGGWLRTPKCVTKGYLIDQKEQSCRIR